MLTRNITILIAILVLALPTITLASHGFRLTLIKAGTKGNNDWYIKPPEYDIMVSCETFSIEYGVWSPHEGEYNYEWGFTKGNNGEYYYLRTNGGEWKKQIFVCSDNTPIEGIQVIEGLSSQWKIDSKTPIIEISKPYQGEAFTTSQVTIEGKITDATSGISSAILNGTNLNLSSDGSFSLTLQKGGGVHTVTIIAKDVAGNPSQLERTFKVLQSLSINPSNGSNTSNQSASQNHSGSSEQTSQPSVSANNSASENRVEKRISNSKPTPSVTSVRKSSKLQRTVESVPSPTPSPDNQSVVVAVESPVASPSTRPYSIINRKVAGVTDQKKRGITRIISVSGIVVILGVATTLAFRLTQMVRKRKINQV